jgi:hypothetical protein
VDHVTSDDHVTVLKIAGNPRNCGKPFRIPEYVEMYREHLRFSKGFPL